jgi:uncharacterized protein
MKEGKKINRKLLFLILPILLIVSTSAVFYLSSIAFGKYPGYLIGFAFYWFFWCLCIPSIITKKSPFEFFKNGKPLFKKKNWWVIILFLITLIVPIFMYNFIPNLFTTSIIVIILAIPFSIIDGFFEELFWRGFYVKEFKNSVVWGIIIPSFFFSLWHFAPQIIFPHDNPVTFVLSTFFLGLVYGIVAYTTKSAKWSAIGHSISGMFAFSGSLASTLFKIIMG